MAVIRRAFRVGHPPKDVLRVIIYLQIFVAGKRDVLPGCLTRGIPHEHSRDALRIKSLRGRDTPSSCHREIDNHPLFCTE